MDTASGGGFQIFGDSYGIFKINHSIFYTLKPNANFGIDIDTRVNATNNGLSIDNTKLGNDAISAQYWDAPNGSTLSGNYAYYPPKIIPVPRNPLPIIKPSPIIKPYAIGLLMTNHKRS